MTQGRMLIRNLTDEARVAHVELPAEMTEAVDTVERLELAFTQLPVTPPVDAAAAMLEDEVYEAVWAGKEVPDVGSATPS